MSTDYFDYQIGGIGFDTAAQYYLDYLTAQKNYEAQKETNEMNYKIHKENLEWNRPVNQMIRLQEAGLNPMLMYSQGNTGNATSMPVMKAPQFNFSPSASIERSMAIRNLREQNRNLNVQNNLIESQSAAAAENARRNKLENDFFEKYGYWPGQESSFLRSLRGGLGVLPDLYFNYVDGLDGVVSHLSSKFSSLPSGEQILDNIRTFLYHYFGPRPAGWTNKIDWSGGRRG